MILLYHCSPFRFDELNPGSCLANSDAVAKTYGIKKAKLLAADRVYLYCFDCEIAFRRMSYNKQLNSMMVDYSSLPVGEVELQGHLSSFYNCGIYKNFKPLKPISIVEIAVSEK